MIKKTLIYQKNFLSNPVKNLKIFNFSDSELQPDNICLKSLLNIGTFQVFLQIKIKLVGKRLDLLEYLKRILLRKLKILTQSGLS